MSVEENRALIQRFVDEAFNRGNLGVVDEIYAPVYVGHTAGIPDQTPGPRASKSLSGSTGAPSPICTPPSRT
jgi:hypothetical protein